MAYGLSLESFLEVQDAKGKSGFILFNHPLDTDLGALKSMIPTSAELLDVLLGGVIINAGISFDLSIAGWDIDPAQSGSDIEEGALFTWLTDIGTPTDFRIPTFSEDFMDDNGVVDLADTDVDAFVQRIISGRTVGLTNVSPSDAYGQDIVSIVGGQEDFLSSR